MKTFKNLLSIVFLLIVASSCEPEEIPIEPLNVSTSHISADTGDQDDEYDDRGSRRTSTDTGDQDDEYDDRG